MLAEACNGKHCPEDLIRMANTKWQKQVAVEFVFQDKRISKQGHKLDTVYKITWGIFIVVTSGAIIQAITVVLPWLTSFL